ncbi:MAG TPA: hypothetical protein VMY35_06445 [Phycisphaerae bacterium]|nr:hypothetical protein [Phycisphaerae bacterium]
MRRSLKRKPTMWHWDDGQRREGPPPGVRGDLTGVRGDLTGVRGDLSGVWGDVSGVRGDLSGVRGDLNGVWGDVDDCKLTNADRRIGVEITELIDEPDGAANSNADGGP